MGNTIHITIVNITSPNKTDGPGDSGISIINAPTNVAGDQLLTEGSDNILTEAGDNLLTN